MILWIVPPKGYSPEQKGVISGLLIKHGNEPGGVIYYNLHSKIQGLSEYQSGKGKTKIPLPSRVTLAKSLIAELVAGLKPSLIVCNDEASLRCITGQPYTLATTRGSVYRFGDNIPVIVVDELTKSSFSPTARFVRDLDLAKLTRYNKGKERKYPAFHYHLCQTVEDVELHVERASSSSLISIDVETSSKFITVVGYTYEYKGGLQTFTVPLFDPNGTDGAYWTEDQELRVRLALAKINKNDTPKCLQNGGYDSAYFIKECMPLYNYVLDSQSLMHCIWIEMPKALHELASYWLDNYTYWKDDGKGVKEDGYGKTRETILKYWRYCGLDTYYTWLVTRDLLSKMVRAKWSMDNYNMEFPIQIGPNLEACLYGILVDENAHQVIMEEQVKKSEIGSADIKALTNEAEFNLNSPKHVAWFLYDFCQQKPTRLQWTDPARRGRKKYGPRSVDEKVLKIMKEQNNNLSWIARNFIDRLLKAKKPGGVLSNYQNLYKLTMRGRFCYGLNAAATDTFRFSSGSNPFWIGRNVQNIPEWLREFLIANPGWVFCSADYSASDDRFIAYESEDPDKMALVESDLDPHCFHASKFFQKPYDDLYKGWKAKERWVVDPIEGDRQNTKRLTHGRNFRMEAYTMYDTFCAKAGRESVIHTAKQLGHYKADGYDNKQLVGICQELIDMYDHPVKGLYKRLRPWQQEIVEFCVNNGNKMTNCFGLTRWFLGDVKNDIETQYALSSCYGQMGTAGNINRALRKAYYTDVFDPTFLYLMQGHDSLLAMARREVLHTKFPQLISIMEEKFTIHGRDIRIPVDPKCGLRWSEDMVSYRDDLSYEEIVKFDRDKFGKKYPKREKNSEALIQRLSSMDFGDLGTPEDEEVNPELEQDLEESEVV